MLTSAQFKVDIRDTPDYQESGQPNPLRWVLAKKQEDGTFVEQTHVFKCRDFFNDFIAKINGVSFAVYGMDTDKLILSKDGMYVVLCNVTEYLEDNLKVLMADAGEEFSYTIEKIEGHDDKRMLWIGPEFLKNTYNISYFTLMVRASNINGKLTSYDDLKDHATESLCRIRFDTLVKHKLTVTPHLKGTWWYYNKEFNSDTIEEVTGDTRYHVHNCGFFSTLFGLGLT